MNNTMATAASCPRFDSAVIAVAILAAGVPTLALAQPDLSIIAEQLVTVRAFDRANRAHGDISGIAVGGGLVVTNAHVLRGAETVVVVDRGENEYAATVRRQDARAGVAILEAEGLEFAGARLALDNPDAAPREQALIYVPRIAPDGALEAAPARGLIAEARRLDPTRPGERPLLIYRHNARVSVREYGMPMLNACGEVIGLIRPDPGLSPRALNDRVGPGESTFGIAGTEVRRALADVGAEMQAATEACPDPGDTLAGLEAEAQAAREAAETARTEAEAATAAAGAAGAEADGARRRADAAEARAAELEADAAATQAERDAARAAAAQAREEAEQARGDAEQARARAEEREAELDDLEQRAQATSDAANEFQARVENLEREQLLLYSALAGAVATLIAIGAMAVSLLRRRRRELEEADAERRRSDEALKRAIKPAPFSCLLEGADDAGSSVVIKVGPDQLGAPKGVVVGRNPAQAGVLLDHPEASREHFRLSVPDGYLLIEDLNSTNGTFVNGTRLRPGAGVKLSDGAEIAVGVAIRARVTITPHSGGE